MSKDGTGMGGVGGGGGGTLALFKKHASVSDTLAELRKNKDFKKSVEKSMSTGRVKLQQNRELLAEKAGWLRTISDELFGIESQIANLTERLGREEEEDAKESTRRSIAIKTIEAQRLMNLAQLTLMGGYLDGLGLQVDCQTIEESCKIKTSEGEVVRGKRRISSAELLAALSDDMEALAALTVEYIHPMLRDIGVKQQAFLGPTGLPMPHKYDLPKAEDEEDDEEEVVGEGEAISDSKMDSKKAKTVEEMRQELSKPVKEVDA